MIKILSLDKSEAKAQKNGTPYMGYHGKFQTDDGGQISAYLNVYDGTVTVGQMIDCKFEKKVSAKGTEYWSGNYNPTKAQKPTQKPTQTGTFQPPRIGYTTDELFALMGKCIEFGTEKAGNIEGCSAIINSLFIACTNNACKVTSTVVKPVAQVVKEQFGDGGFYKGTEFNDEPVTPPEESF